MAAARALEAAGAKLVKVRLPHTPYAIPTYYIVATAEASSNLARYDGVHYGHRAAGRARTSTRCSPSRAARGSAARSAAASCSARSASPRATTTPTTTARCASGRCSSRTSTRRSRRCDVLLGPTSPTPAFKLGEKANDPLKMYLSDILTGALNLAGVPGLVVPCGVVHAGGKELPVGAQLIGPYFSEALLFRVGQVDRGRALEPDPPVRPPRRRPSA